MGVGRSGRNLFHVVATWALLVTLLPGAALAGTVGKIAGRILDKQTKRPLEGVSLAVPLARTGALTDAEGRYQILNLPAGVYEVKVALMGYRATTITDVVVSSDNTTALDVSLDSAPVAMDEIVVSAQRPVVDLKLTSNVASLDREQIKSLPVQELQDVVNLQAGVVDGHFRGGRIGEVQYQVDGVSVNNAYDNKSSLRIDRSLLEEVQVISGTFDAEYGQAMSGVVNAVLRRGTDRFRWDVEAMGGGFMFEGGERRRVDFVFRPFGTQNYQASVSGPTGLPKTYFLASLRRYAFDDYLTAERRFTPWVVREFAVPFDTTSSVVKAQNPDGDGERKPLGYSREWSGVGKLTNRSLKDIELGYQAVWNVVDSRDVRWAMRLNPDGITKKHTFSITHGLDITHTLSKTTYYNLSLRQNYFDYHDRLYDSAYDPRYDQAGTPEALLGYEYDAIVQGVELGRFKQRSDTRVIKGAFVSQLSRDQQIKFGGELQWPQITFGQQVHVYELGGVLERAIDEPPFRSAARTYRPYQAAAFAQQEVEWNDLRLRAGVRFDYFNARQSQPSDLANPANALEDQPLSHPVAASRKTSFSPRIGVSYPVTKDAALFFAYGHFYQMPSIGDVFRNADFGVLADIQASTPIGIKPVMGNPDIRPEQTVQYQFGYKQALAEWLGMDVTLFYKDIRDLLGVELIETYNGAVYAHLTNVDFGNVVGFTLTLDQRRRGLLSTSLDYTWQSAIGNSSDPNETATRAAAGQDPRPRQIPFNWDQRHTLNGTVTFSADKSFAVSTIVRVASGQPYTPATAIGNGLEANSGRKPIGMTVDVRAERQIAIGRGRGSLFARVFNALDSRYFNGPVFDTTGDPYYSRFDDSGQSDANALADPTRLYAPRRIEVGITLGAGE